MAPFHAGDLDQRVIGFQRVRKLFELINQFRLRMAPFQVWKVDHRLIDFEKEKKLLEKLS